MLVWLAGENAGGITSGLWSASARAWINRRYPPVRLGEWESENIVLSQQRTDVPWVLRAGGTPRRRSTSSFLLADVVRSAAERSRGVQVERLSGTTREARNRAWAGGGARVRRALELQEDRNPTARRSGWSCPSRATELG
jgi:hypothetical protein